MQIQNTEITLDRIRCYAYHGVMEQERIVGGEYLVSLRLTLGDATAAIENDRLSGTVNYAEVYELVQREMAQPSALLEHVAGRILHALFDEFPLIMGAQVEVRKKNPPMGADCAGAAVVIKAVRE